MSTAYSGQPLTPLARTLAYSTPGFDARINFINVEKERLQRNMLLAEKEKQTLAAAELEWQYKTRALDYEYNKKEEVEKIKAAADVDVAEFKYKAEMVKPAELSAAEKAYQTRTGTIMAEQDAIKPQERVNKEYSNVSKLINDALGGFNNLGIAPPKVIENDNGSFIYRANVYKNGKPVAIDFADQSEAVAFYKDLNVSINSIREALNVTGLQDLDGDDGKIGRRTLQTAFNSISSGDLDMADLYRTKSYKLNIQAEEETFQEQNRKNSIPSLESIIVTTYPKVVDKLDSNTKTIGAAISELREKYPTEIENKNTDIGALYNALLGYQAAKPYGDSKIDFNLITFGDLVSKTNPQKASTSLWNSKTK